VTLLSFQDFIQTGELNERLIVLNNSAKYNQVLILGGGAGSGKGFALSNFVDSSNYKVRDVDEIKRLLQKLSAAGKIDVRKMWSIESKTKSKLKPAEIKKVSKVLAMAHYKLENLNLKEPDHVFTLHIMTSIMGWKNNSLAALSKSIPEDSKHKPNIVFDITAKDMMAAEKTVKICLGMGYVPKDIHLIWVLTDYKIAIKNNLGRDRVVPDDILLQTHEGAAETMTDVIGGKAPRGLDGSVWTILNNKENTIFWSNGDGKLKGTPEFHQSNDNQKATAKVDQAKYDRIYGDGAFVKRNNRTGGSFEKEKIVVKSFSRVHLKKPGKAIGVGVLPFKEQIYNWVIKNVPSSAQKALRIGFGVLLGKSGGS